ncbi:LOG family protein [Arthrobacter rhombi]|uniref:LOG family protein n=1 Tax=Arthrobacter rhombi TaxID=71253 RepID=UPI0031DC507F
MKSTPSMQSPPHELDIDTLEQFDAHTPGGAAQMTGWHLQSVDLRGRGRILEDSMVTGAVFLGCELPAGSIEGLRRRGALIFPELLGLPFDPYRGGLYTAAELYSGLGEAPYEQTPDARIYAWTRRSATGRGTLDAALATTLHDHAIGSALGQLLAAPEDRDTDRVTGNDDGNDGGNDDGAPGPGHGSRGVVGVMGGHAAERGSAGYAAALRLGAGLARAGFTVATGGGPGAMEAANLGAYLSGEDGPTVRDAVATLEQVPSFRPSITEWARAALAVLERHPHGRASVGIPTWFYGHEPPNVFATHVAKYFANSIREDRLLTACTGGLVVLPGAAGTVQEIFQDACENYYGSAAVQTPMILVGRRHWTHDLPAWLLLRALAEGRDMADSIHLVDDIDEAVTLLANRPPRSA